FFNEKNLFFIGQYLREGPIFGVDLYAAIYGRLHAPRGQLTNVNVSTTALARAVGPLFRKNRDAASMRPHRAKGNDCCRQKETSKLANLREIV
ncbi:unnamed protein product, partial [Ixodes pacificus]